jgi:hypothetical protein
MISGKGEEATSSGWKKRHPNPYHQIILWYEGVLWEEGKEVGIVYFKGER